MFAGGTLLQQRRGQLHIVPHPLLHVQSSCAGSEETNLGWESKAHGFFLTIFCLCSAQKMLD